MKISLSLDGTAKLDWRKDMVCCIMRYLRGGEWIKGFTLSGWQEEPRIDHIEHLIWFRSRPEKDSLHEVPNGISNLILFVFQWKAHVIITQKMFYYYTFFDVIMCNCFVKYVTSLRSGFFYFQHKIFIFIKVVEMQGFFKSIVFFKKLVKLGFKSDNIGKKFSYFVNCHRRKY